MRLLFLTPQHPYPPRQGAALRNWGIIRALAREHEVHLLTFADHGEVPPGLASFTAIPEPSRSRGARLRDLLTSREPDMARRLWSGPYAAALAGLLSRHDFDVVQVEAIELVPYALPYLGREGAPAWVYDAHNAETALQRSAFLADLRQPRRLHAALYSAIQVWKLRRYEALHVPRFDLVVAVSEEDARLIRSSTGVEPLVLPNGIDTDELSPERYRPAPELSGHSTSTLVFTGKMDFRPNVDGALWFTDSILPLIGGGARLWIVGQRPHPALLALDSHPQVTLTGWVDAVEPYLMGADVVVVPLRMGSGTRLKVLQALSLGRPVVGTSLGCAGLGARDGEHLLLADDAESFAGAVRKVLAEPEQAAAMAARGRAHVRQHFDWGVLVPRLAGALSSLREQAGAR